MVYVLESDKDLVRKLTIGVTQEPLKYGPFSAFFLLSRFTPTTDSLKPSVKKHNSVTVIMYQLKIEAIIAR